MLLLLLLLLLFVAPVDDIGNMARSRPASLLPELLAMQKYPPNVKEKSTIAAGG